jgi:hypothetical protein
MSAQTDRQYLNSILQNFQLHGNELFAGKLHIPCDFKAPDQQEFVSIVNGIAGYKEYYPTILVLCIV